MRQRPALRFALVLAGGIAFADAFSPPPIVAYFLLVTLSLASFFSSVPRLRHPVSTIFFHLLLFVLGVCLASVQESDLRERRIVPRTEADSVRLVCVLEEPPLIQKTSVRLVVETDSMVLEGFDQVRRRHLVFGPKIADPSIGSLEAGQTLLVIGVIDDFPQARNPGEFDYGRFLTLSEIDGIIRAGQIVPLNQHHRSLTVRQWFSVVRSKLGKILEVYHSPEQASFLRGVIFGDRRDLPVDLKESFLETGTIHILAVSGSNVAVVALILFLTLGLCRIPRTGVILLTMLGLIFYMMLTGASASIVRATIMGCVLLGGKLTERRTDIYNSIAVAACAVLLWSPLQLFDVGFQLSFAAVISIVYLYPKLDEMLKSIPAKWEEIRALHMVWQVFAVSFAAQLGTLPFTAYYFGRFSIIALAANLIVVPLVGLNLAIGCLTIGLSVLSHAAGSIYAAVNEVLSNILLGTVRVAAAVPFASVETWVFSGEAVVLYYGVLLALLHVRHPGRFKTFILLVVLVLLAGLYRKIAESGEDVLRITTLDVGQGDSHVIELPGGKVVLIDAGPTSPGFDAGKKIVEPFLRRKGIDRLDALVITHPHADHSGGMRSLLEGFPVGRLVTAELPGDSIISDALLFAGLGDEISPHPRVRIYVLHPFWRADSGSSTNNRSLVLKLQYGSTTALLTGDAERWSEEILVRRYGSFLDADVLKTGHHGSKTSTSGPFLRSITPDFAIISVGRRNRFRHPSAAVVAQLRSGGAVVARTDRDGAVVLESDGTAWKHIHWRARSP